MVGQGKALGAGIAGGVRLRQWTSWKGGSSLRPVVVMGVRKEA